MPQGSSAERPARRPGPAAHTADQAQWRAPERDLGRGLCRDRTAPAAHHRSARTQRYCGGGGQPVGAQDRTAELLSKAGACAWHAKRFLGLDAGPDAQATGQRHDVRSLAFGRAARHRTHRLVAGHWRQSAGQQWQHVDGAGLQGQGQSDAGTRRQADRDRPATHGDGSRCRCAPLHPPRRRCVSTGRHAAHTVCREPGALGRGPELGQRA